MTLQRIAGERTIWVDITDTSIHDVAALRRAYPDFHPLNLEDIMSPIERPKIDDQGDHLFIVLHFPLWDAKMRLSRPSEVDFFIGRGYIITVHDGVLKPLTQLLKQVVNDESVRRYLLDKSSGHTFYVILDKLVDYMFPILNRVDYNIRDIEERIFADEGMRLIRSIAEVRRDAISLRRIIRNQVPILDLIERMNNPIIVDELDEYFGDIVDHAKRARDIIDENVEVISGLGETADTLLNHRLNGVIRVLTVFSVIMLPLTLVSSIFGMNVDLPLADHPHAFIYLNVLMIVLAVLMLIYFRMRRWL